MNSKEIQYIRREKEVVGVCGGRDSSTKHVIFNDSFAAAQEWYESTTLEHCQSQRPRKLKSSCKTYINSNAHFSNKPVGFFPGLIWWFIAKLIINWIIGKIIEHIIKDTLKRKDKDVEKKEDPKNPDRLI